MAYQADKPKDTSNMKNDSVVDIRTNFADLKTTFDINHVNLTGTLNDEGKHNSIQMPEGQVPEVNESQSGLSVVQGAASGVSELQFSQLFVDGTRVDYTISEGLLADEGYSNFNGGTRIVWGFKDIVAGTVQDTIVYPRAFQQEIYQIQLFVVSSVAAVDPDTVAYVTGNSVGSFRVNLWRRDRFNTPGAQVNVRLRYIAIGR